jgi:hypothetical protein
MVVSTDGQEPPTRLGPDERAELERLRAEVEAFRQRTERRRAGLSWRSVLAVFLIVLGSALAPLAVTARWLDTVITDTDRYVATVAPLASDPAIQRTVTDRITNEVFNRIDVQGLTNQTADALARQGVPEAITTGLHAMTGPIANGIKNWTHDQVSRLVSSDQFATAWTEANRTAHAQLVAALTGSNSGAVVIQGDNVSVKLAPFVEAVKQRLIANGFSLASKIPAVNTEIVIFRSADVGKAQRYFRLLTTLGTWLPILSLALLLGGVLAATGRRRALVGASVGLALGMVLLGVALAVIRPVYLNAVPQNVLPSDAAAVIFDTIVVYLRTTLRAVLAVAVVVGAAAYLSGPAPAAIRTRRAVRRGVRAVQSGAWRLGLHTGPVGTWVGRYKRILQWVTLGIAGLVLVFWDYPTAAVVGVVALCALVVLALIELIAVAPRPAVPTH